MKPSQPISGVDPGLLAWAETVTGGHVTAAAIATAGQARLTALLSIDGGGWSRVVLRHDTGAGALAGTPFSLHHEALAYRALRDTGLAVPTLIGESDDGHTILVDEAPGVVAVRHEALPDLLDQLGRLHALDIDSLPLEGFTAPGLHDLDGWKIIYRDRVTRQNPLLDLAFRVLPELEPTLPARPSLCHGDPGAGNYLVDEGRVSALLDWELSHLGDPLDDLAWLSIRASQYGLDLEDFGDLASRHWSPCSGLAIDETRLQYWQAVGLVRMLVMCLAATTRPRSRKERLIQMLVEPPCEAQLIGLLAHMTGVHLDNSSALSSEDLLAGFPAREVSEAAEDLSETFLPLLSGTPNEPWLRRIRQTLRQVGERGFALSPSGQSETSGNVEDLHALHRRSRARLAWLPRSAAVAKPLASFASKPGASVP